MEKQNRSNPSSVQLTKNKSKRREREMPTGAQRYEMPLLDLKVPVYDIPDNITPEEVFQMADADGNEINAQYYDFAMRTHLQSRGVET